MDAASELFEKHGLAAVTIDALVERAGVAKGTFYVHFDDRQAFLREVHRDLHQRLADAIAAACESLPAGLERLDRGIEAYLDGCLAERGRKALLFDARSETALSEDVARQNDSFSRRVAADLRAARHPQPLAAARLVVAMAAETAFHEMRSGKRDAALRSALRHLVDASAKVAHDRGGSEGRGPSRPRRSIAT